jgi:hypothetical protein
MKSAPWFSDDDIIEIINATGLRSAITRNSGPGHDRLDLLIPYATGSSYRFERDVTGSTYLLVASSDDLRLVAVGTLADCLQTFPTRSER